MGRRDRARLRANAPIHMFKLRGATDSRDERGGRRHASPLRRRSGKVFGARSPRRREDDASLSHGGSRRSSGFAESSDSGELHRPKSDRGARALCSLADSFEPIKSAIASHLACPRDAYGGGGASAGKGICTWKGKTRRAGP